MLYQYAENFICAYSHDEVTHGKASMLFKMGAQHIPEKAANLRALYGFMWGWPGKKLLFMGSDFGQAHEWNHNTSLDWHLCKYLDHEGRATAGARPQPALSSEPVLSCNDLNAQGFRWISCNDAASSVLAWMRLDAFEQTIFVVGRAILRRSSGPDTASACRAGAGGRKSSTPTANTTVAAAWAMTAAR